MPARPRCRRRPEPSPSPHPRQPPRQQDLPHGPPPWPARQRPTTHRTPSASRTTSSSSSRPRSPGHARSIGHVRGLSGDTKLVGIDYRVQTGALHGVGDRGGFYTLDTHNAKAAKVSQLTVDLDGQYFVVDFNPAGDRLRQRSESGRRPRGHCAACRWPCGIRFRRH
ncbi:DUF4394 domain-containing protein [Streptomyces sp. NPDC056465]|uniref:DUF4394 domain-containing protein n=1 Tax=Streptomyces sp. NPDC056465 TaxID=3345829 RepID=UPI00369E0C0C